MQLRFYLLGPKQKPKIFDSSRIENIPKFKTKLKYDISKHSMSL